MSSLPPAFGYFGKLPCAGDFLRRDLSPGFLVPWDAWLQRLMTDLDASDAYLRAPIWRFALAPGLCGPRAASGILLPSVDRVGRRFPFCIAHESDAPLWTAYLALQPHLAGLEDLALSMLGGTDTRAALDGALSAWPAPDLRGTAPSDPPGLGSIWTAEAAGHTLSMTAPGLPDGRALFDLTAPHWAPAPTEPVA